jgi:hypothetical protein
MGRKNEKLEEMLSIPVTKEMKQVVIQIAHERERSVADMGRRLLAKGIKVERTGREAVAAK